MRVFGRDGHGNRSLYDLIKTRFRRFKNSYLKRKEKIANKLAEAFSPGSRIRARNHSILFIGYCEAALGLGESFRNLLRALDRVGLAFSIYPFNSNVEARWVGPFLESRYDLDGVYDINVIYLAAEQLPYVLRQLNKQVSESGYNILRTYWELPLAPAEWANSLSRFDELWVPTAFVAEAFRAIFDGVITTVPVCINVERGETFGRDHFGLEEDVFYFLFSFDYYSGTARKNPLGVVQAFVYAFQDRRAKIRLIIKSSGAEALDATTARLLVNFTRLDDRIIYLNQSMTRDEILSLLATCDCYISLHRSEGFGMGMAEAMALGKPVIATDFSGNLDFLNAETGFPVPSAVRPLAAGEYLNGEGQAWAEPDLGAAIDLMRAVIDNPEERERRAHCGRCAIVDRHSAAAVAKVVEARLEAIRTMKGFF